mmetsp:Transcript_47156/g.47589  ORF Transcript_47156/g.47589 Transcript_47156/m.47589 type:complete len:86 (+) Transcript_47156:722-979(+)
MRQRVASVVTRVRRARTQVIEPDVHGEALRRGFDAMPPSFRDEERLTRRDGYHHGAGIQCPLGIPHFYSVQFRLVIMVVVRSRRQ